METTNLGVGSTRKKTHPLAPCIGGMMVRIWLDRLGGLGLHEVSGVLGIGLLGGIGQPYVLENISRGVTKLCTQKWDRL